MAIDYASTPEADTNRQRKALTLARLAWRYAMTPDDVAWLDAGQRAAMAKEAGVHPPGDGSPTWDRVVDRLAGMWAAAGHPKAPPHDLMRQITPFHPVAGDAWPETAPIPTPERVDAPPTRPKMAPPRPFGDRNAAPPARKSEPRLPDAAVRACEALETAPGGPDEPQNPPKPGCLAAEEPVNSPITDGPGPESAVNAPIPADPPRGWARTAGLPPLDPPRTCSACPNPAVIVTLDVERCAQHPPMPGEWGHQLDFTAHPHRGCAPTRCYCGTCPGVKAVLRITRRQDLNRAAAE